MRSRSSARSHPDHSTTPTRRRLAARRRRRTGSRPGRPAPLRRRRRAPHGSARAHGRDQPRHRQRLPRAHRAVRRPPAGIAAAARRRGQAAPRREPQHDLRRRRRHDRRVDLHVVHPAGHADDRDAQRGGPRRERGRQPRVRPGLRRPHATACMPLASTGSTSRANVYDKATGDPALPEYWIKEFGERARSASSALSPRSSRRWSARPASRTSGRKSGRSVNRVADQLSDGELEHGEADIVVLLVHEGAATTDSRRRPTRTRASARSC